MSSSRRPWPFVVVAALLAGASWLGAPAPRGAGAGEAGAKAEHLPYRRTYGEALAEARIRNVPVFVSRHKDF